MPTSIFIAGHRGLVGSALVRAFEADPAYSVVTRTRAELDLLDRGAVKAFYENEKPQQVIVAAAKVGGIKANSDFPVEFLLENLQIQNHLIAGAAETGVEKLLFLGSSCIYPKFAKQPMTEDQLLTGILEPTNEPYAIAKIAGIKLCQAYWKQYSKRFISAMPTNLYGPRDNFHLENSHVLPALIHKLHIAKTQGADTVTLWGTGSPKREFLYSDDLAAACKLLMEKYESPEIVNIGCGEDVTIKELAEIVRQVVGFSGEILWDSTKPDGTPRKLLDISRIRALGWSPTTPLPEGVRAAYDWFLENR